MKKIFDEIPYITGSTVILKKLEPSDAEALDVMRHSRKTYKYLPTFLFENKYEDIDYTIKMIYDECFKNKESVIMGVYAKEDMRFCGLTEFYGWDDDQQKISVGGRIYEKEWGNGFGSEALEIMLDYLFHETDIEVVTASSMVENDPSAAALIKNGFIMTDKDVEEDWGFAEKTLEKKWVRYKDNQVFEKDI